MGISWQSGDWRLICDLEDGGRISSARWRGLELLTQPHLPNGSFRAPAPDYGLYETRPVFGYDDCWPSVQPSVWTGLGREVRDHGELIWRQWENVDLGETLSCTVGDADQGWIFRREVSASGSDLRFAFTCSNTGSAPMPMHWAGHVLVPPLSVVDLELPEFASARQTFPMPSAIGARTGGEVWSYLSGLPAGTSVFVAFDEVRGNELRVSLGEYDWRWRVTGLERPSLGLWFNRRGYPTPSELARDEFGIEWMTGESPRLEDAVREGSAVVLRPGENVQWGMEWSISVRYSRRDRSARLDDTALTTR